MRAVKKLWMALFSIYAFIWFLVIMLLLFPFVVAASFLGRIKGGHIIYKLCTVWSDTCCFFWGIEHKNWYEQPDDSTRSYVFVFNHASYMDIPVLLKAFRRHRIRILGKAEMVKIPLFGFIYKKAVILVNRSNAEARSRSVVEMKTYLQQNISVVIAPEGTFNTSQKPLKSFYDGAFRIAIETQTPIRPVIFLDTLHRLHHQSIFSMTPGKSRAVFLEEIAVTGLTLNNLNDLKEKTYLLMESALIKYKAK